MTTIQARFEVEPLFSIDAAALRRAARYAAAIAGGAVQVFGVVALLYLFAAGPGLLDDRASTVPVASTR